MEQVRLTTGGRRPGKGWRSVTRGAHRLVDAPDVRTAELLAWQAVLPDEARFTHLTGAGLHGLWLPPVPHDAPVWVVLPYGVTRPVRPGLRVLRAADLPPPCESDGVRVETAARCIQRAARDLHELDLTCLLDAARHLGRTTGAELALLADTVFPGAPRFRRALAWSDDRADSTWEVLLRILHQVCEVEVVPQHELHDDAGTFLARGDLWLRGTHVFHEYDGGDHLDRRQQRHDLKRHRRLDGAHWSRRGYTSADVLHQAVTILRDADRALGREHDPGRVRAWHDLLRRSLFTPAGTQVLRSRLGRGRPVGEMVARTGGPDDTESPTGG